MDDSKIIESITNIGAVVLGFFLGQGADWFKSKREDAKERSNTRMIVDFEMTRNRSHVDDYWKNLVTTNIYDKHGNLCTLMIGQSIIKLSLPPLSKEVWTASLSKIADAYSAQELEVRWNKYIALEQVVIAQAELRDLEAAATDHGRHAEALHASSSGFLSAFVRGSHFSGGAEVLVKTFIENLRVFLGNSFVELPKTKPSSSVDADAQ